MLTGKDVHNIDNISGEEIYFENNIKHSANDSKTIGESITGKPATRK